MNFSAQRLGPISLLLVLLSVRVASSQPPCDMVETIILRSVGGDSGDLDRQIRELVVEVGGRRFSAVSRPRSNDYIIQLASSPVSVPEFEAMSLNLQGFLFSKAMPSVQHLGSSCVGDYAFTPHRTWQLLVTVRTLNRNREIAFKVQRGEADSWPTDRDPSLTTPKIIPDGPPVLLWTERLYLQIYPVPGSQSHSYLAEQEAGNIDSEHTRREIERKLKQGIESRARASQRPGRSWWRGFLGWLAGGEALRDFNRAAAKEDIDQLPIVTAVEFELIRPR